MKTDKSIIIGGVLYRRGQEVPIEEPARAPEPEPVEAELEPAELPKLKGKK